MKDKENNGTFNRVEVNRSNRDSNSNKYRGNNFNLPNFFDKKEYKVFNPYNFAASLERLKTLDDDYFFKDMEAFTKKEFDFDFTPDEKFMCHLDELKILTDKKEKENDNFFSFVKLVDFGQYSNQSVENKFEFRLFNDSKKKEISIKCHVDFDLIAENVDNLFNEKLPFEKSRNLVKKAKISFTGKKKPELDLLIKYNMVKRIYETSKEEYLILELTNPPTYRTNFLKVSDNNNIRTEFENVLFPFRNFEDDVINLKYRKFYLLLKLKTPTGDQGKMELDDMNIFGNNTNFLRSLLENVTEKIDFITCNIYEEKQLREQHNLQYELNDYFRIFRDKFLTEFEFEEKYLISFNYQMLVLISENILSYFNAIEFLENIINHKSKDYFRHVFDNQDFRSELFAEALVKIIEHYKSADIELTTKIFEEDLISWYNTCKLELEINGDKAFKKKNRRLMRNMRVLVTPTYTLFMPYMEDQGNRILREHREPYQAMRLVFKMDDFQDARWNNKFLKEFIKIYLLKGISLSQNVYEFFCYSQSQFRSMGCWLVIDPDEILQKTGDYSGIKIIAKFGARVGQTLTSTVKTIKIHESNIEYIDDVKKNNYTFSDGVGTISYDLATGITRKLGLDEVPAAYQGRFLGCKGVWTVLFNDTSSQICIRPSQNKFVKKAEGHNQRFEVCGYAKFIKSYLNRQIILLLSALGVKNEVFIKKLMIYRDRLEDEKFILSLIHYEEWNSMFMNMFYSGVNRTNDRLIRSIVSANKEILYRDLKKKARIYIEEGAYVMGIMDELGVLEPGEAFLRIRYDNLDMVLDRECSVAKCPCLHPGDIRLLRFRKHHKDDAATQKYEALERYENVIIFPQKGERPHPNELSGSDLDGDQYFVFYDPELCTIKTVEPMDYSDNSKAKEKTDITRSDVIEFFADFINSNNLGLIADAHLAHSDSDPLGARGEIPKILAKKFSRAVDAPKTGEEVYLEDNEEAKKFPHYMGKERNSYTSHHILGKLYDRTVKYIEDIDKYKSQNNKFYDESLLLPDYRNFLFEALIYYSQYYDELLAILKKNDVKCESELLTGNNVDNDVSGGFGKKKNNYDIIERIAIQMKELFVKYKSFFNHSSKQILKHNSIYTRDNLRNNQSARASAFYYACYDFLKIMDDISNNEDELDNMKWNFQTEIFKEGVYDFGYEEALGSYVNYANVSYGGQFGDQVHLENLYVNEMENRKQEIIDLLEKWRNLIKIFIVEKTKSSKFPRSANEENQFRILSFPWCAAGDILILIKEIIN